MTARFLMEADSEFREAARYYEGEVPGLGFAFVGEINRTVGLLVSNPELGAPVSKSMRKMPVRRFPYKLIYAAEPEGIVIVAVAHHKRRPFYWRRRSKLLRS